jgi:hypothetical protein
MRASCFTRTVSEGNFSLRDDLVRYEEETFEDEGVRTRASGAISAICYLEYMDRVCFGRSSCWL